MPPSPDDKSSLERLRNRLYAPEAVPTLTPPPLSAHHVPEPVETWQAPLPPKKPRLPLVSIFFIVTMLFFVAALGVAAALLLFGGRTVSTDHIEITVEGPTTIGSGDTVPLLIRVKNNNPVEISSTDLTVTFPEGTRAPDAPTEPLSHYSDTVGDLAPGATGDRTVQAVFFGSEGQKVRVPVKFEYRAPGSNTAFVKETAYEFTITTSPLSVTVGSLSQVSAGQPFTVAVSVRSNAPAPIPYAALLAEYPPGFTPQSTNPAPIAGGLFDLGTLNPGEEKMVTIVGSLSGEDQDTRVFRFTTGTRGSEDGTRLAISYTTTQSPVKLERPFLAPTLSLNRDTSGALVLKTGQQVDSVLSWINTLDVPVQDAELTLRLGGTALDAGSVRSANGFYRSGDRTIVFSKETIPALAQVGPGETGNGAFVFSTKGGTAAASLRNPTVTIDVSIAGRRTNERNVPTTVSSTLTRTLKVETDLALSGRSLRTTGPFSNTGPWPPKVDQETTYTIEWKLTNSVNSVGGGKVTAVLPSYVRFTGQTSPSSESVTYHEATRTVTWAAGDVQAGATRTASFQVALTPSGAQRGTSPALVTSQKATGTDRFTSGTLESVVPDLSTSVESDPAWNPGVGAVQ